MSASTWAAAHRPSPVFSSILALLLTVALVGAPALAQTEETEPGASDGAATGRPGFTAALPGGENPAPPARTGMVSAYEITSPAGLFSGSYAEGRLHDFMMENDRIAVVVSAIDHIVHYASSGGNIIDAGSSTNRLDAIREVYTYFDDDWPRQAVYDSLQIVDDGSSGGPAVIRTTGVDSNDSSLEVVTEYSLEADVDHVMITTTLTNRGSGSINDFELGDAFNWGECRKFAPLHGFDITGQTTTGPWLAGTADPVTYGYPGHYGDIWGPHGSTWSDMNATVADIGPGDTVSYCRALVVGGRDIASAATVIHEILNSPVGSVQCTVRNAATGQPLRGAIIDAYNDLGEIYLQMETDATGSAGTTLPPGNWRLVASSEKFIPQEVWLVVAVGGYESHDFVLPPKLSLDPKDPTLYRAIGDTLTVIQRPLVNIPAIVVEGDILHIDCDADEATTGWGAALTRGAIEIPLDVQAASHDPSTLWWRLSCPVPQVALHELYDLRITADGGIDDVTLNAVKVIPAFKNDYYFIHITDTHLPTHMYYTESGSEKDRSEEIDLLEVMADIDIINPEFVLLTGDLVNEGELEDFLNWRVYTRAQALLCDFPVPVFLTAGNHDIGGWDDTPPPDGTARRDWWRFFGWNRLDDPPPGAPWYTQN